MPGPTPRVLLRHWLCILLHACDVACDQVEPAKVIILEGILVLHIPELREQCSMCIYVDTGKEHTASLNSAPPPCLPACLPVWLVCKQCLLFYMLLSCSC